MSVGAPDLWLPASGCYPACLPVDGAVPAVSAARQAARLLAVLGMLLLGVGMAAVLPVLPVRERRTALRSWARATVRAFGVRLVVRGRLPRRRALVVANHVSWLDVPALLAVAPARMVAKGEVRGWPLLGLLARVGGTLFVDRSRPRDLPEAVGRVRAALRTGHTVAVFPEGTTWCGVSAGCRPARGFRPALFQAAVDAGTPVVPLRISYGCAGTGAPSTATAFLGEETLWRSVRRVLAAPGLVVSVTVAGVLHPAAGTDRRALARAAESAVRLVPSSAGRPSAAPRRVSAGPPAAVEPAAVEPAGELDLAA
ncbi:lysophospholipid acyltransferase family protein [Micromonospora nigra]|uniref:lysophospholipid acyltransferase family protein n=1 Tax=Micromonospora nigra TaxID=145857 RepID=UPI000B80AA52|nr:lysophospholipid acyltransferase family protein [Micromonospora nigra]